MLWTGLLALTATDCSREDRTTETASARGERIYRNVCSTCHNVDPKHEGVAGPAIAGSSRELLEARVLRAEYPSGYTPKRNSKIMPPLPHLEPHIGDLSAYLETAAGSPTPPAASRQDGSTPE
jgi:mono/diheme cytochrome c family protein